MTGMKTVEKERRENGFLVGIAMGFEVQSRLGYVDIVLERLLSTLYTVSLSIPIMTETKLKRTVGII